MLGRMVKSATFCLLILVFVNAASAQVCQPASVGLTSWWSADGNALDSRSRNNGTLQNGATLSAGHVGQAFSLDGSNDFVEVPNTASLNPTAQITIEAWINPSVAPTGGRRIVDKITAGGMDGYVLQLNNRRLNFIVGSQNLIGATIINENTWTHVVGTYDGALTRIYLNGVLEGELGGITFIPTNALNLHIGADSSGGSLFAGSIDEPAIYDRALSASEIAAIHAAGTAGKCKPTATAAPSDQVAWFAGDGNPNDTVGANNGTLQSGAAHVVGKVGQGFSFDGAGGVLSTPASSLNNAFSALSIETWVNPATHGTDTSGTFGKTIVSNTHGDGFALRLHNGVIQSDLRLTTGDSRQTFGPVLPLNAWSHVVVTYDGANVRAFLDGVQVGSDFPASGTVRNTANSGVCFFVGGDPGPTCSADTGFGFHGRVDEVSIYSRALSAAEIQSIFNAGVAGKLKEVATAGTTATVGDVTVTYPSAAARRTHQIPLEEDEMPPLPMGMTPTGLLYDIATNAMPSGVTDLCFNLPAFANLSNSEFLERRILHLEGASWINRTISWSFANKTICARVPAFSPFAIVDSNIAPTASNVSVGGRIVAADGRGIYNVRVSMTDESGNTRTALTNGFGHYRFDSVEVGRMYLISVSSKRYQFENPTRFVNVVDELSDVDFNALPEGAGGVRALDPFSSLSR